LRHYGISKPLAAFHQFNEREREQQILEKLKEGQTIALLSDAGTPLISDPGLLLVRACIKQSIPFTALPGPCSVIQALVLSGFGTSRFQFIGFLPKETMPLKETLHRALFYRGTTIAFESPQRLISTLEHLLTLDPERELAVARELTKTFEECPRGTPSALLAKFKEQEPRGEIVLLISEGSLPEETLGVEELISLLQEFHGLSLKEAIKLAAKFKGIPKRDVYRQVHKE
jgi:16S rRNA (cytidine1402-2'-O)-methyltransferase